MISAYRQIPPHHTNQKNSNNPTEYIPDPMGRIGRGHWVSTTVTTDNSLATRLGEFRRQRTPDVAVGPPTFDKPVGRNQPNRPQDVANIENLLARTGHYDASLTDGSTGYFSRRLDAAIRNYQSDNSLTSDGIVAPNGPTIVSLYNEAESPARGTTEVWERSENGTVTAVAIPVIAYKIAEYFGIAVIAAWTWWQAMSPEQRKGILQRIDEDETEETNSEHCEDLLNYEDKPRCNELSNKGESEAAAMCWKSAYERYSACRRGVPINELPPLNAWNN